MRPTPRVRRIQGSWSPLSSFTLPSREGARGTGHCLAPDPQQHRRGHLIRNRDASRQPVGQLVVGYLQQRLQRRNLRLVQEANVRLHETAQQEVILVRPAVRGAIQQSAAPRIERGYFWFTHRRGVI